MTVSPSIYNARIVGLPQRWPDWPYLKVRRYSETDPFEQRGIELGVMVDLFRYAGITGYSATVFKIALEDVPSNADALLTQPREVYDTPEEVVAHGWQPDLTD